MTGDISVTASAEVAEGAAVHGDLQAALVDVAGTIEGNVTARDLVAIRSSAVVRGELSGSRVAIEPGSRVAVRLDMEFQLDPASIRR